MKQIALLLEHASNTSGDKCDDTTAFDISVKRSKRRSLSLSVAQDRVVVRAPLRAPKYVINDFVTQNTQWIIGQLAIQKSQQAERQKIAHGETVSILGNHYKIVVKTLKQNSCRRQIRVEANNNIIYIHIDLRNDDNQSSLVKQLTHNAFLDWLPKFITQEFQHRTLSTAKLCSAQHKLSTINYRRTRSKWGHCTSTGNIQYNPLIALAPLHVIDYIIAHEVCHLRHQNHSREFWYLVSAVCSNYKLAEQWLRDRGHTVSLEYYKFTSPSGANHR